MITVTPQDELDFPAAPDAYVQAKAKLDALKKQGLHRSGILGRTKSRRESRLKTSKIKETR